MELAMKVRRIISCLLLTACCTCFGSSFTINASGIQSDAAEKAAWPTEPEIAGGAAIVMDVNSKTILYEKNVHEQLYPASITKIMTALLAVENSELDEKVTFSYDSVHKTEGSGIWRDVDEVMTMEQCLYALMLNSANECAYAIAEHTGKTYEDFVKMMNERASALGCKDTHFNNPHGLPDEEHYTSCYDMALIASEAIQNDTFREITGTKRYEIPPTNKHPDEITYLKNHQKMLFEDEKYYYEYCIGGKTGYTSVAGSTLVTFAEKDGMTLVCVVMKEESPGHYEDSIALLNYCFENFRAYNIAENLKEDTEAKFPEDGFLSCDSFANIDKEAGIVLPVGAEFKDADTEVLYDEKKKDTVGTLQYTYAGHVVGSVDIEIMPEDVKEYSFKKQENAKEQEEKKVVKISVTKIIFVILGVLALAAAAFGIYKFKDNFYILRYRFRTRKKGTVGNDVIKRKRRKRKR